jgi:predicted RNA-binding Zn-ribbon protein involved in translation (DUF1610 family)
LWQGSGLENTLGASHNRGMACNTWTIEYFSCPNCGVPYTATREQYADKQSGNFRCEVCGSKVHTWSGNYDFFDWKVDQAKSPAFGRRWG